MSAKLASLLNRTWRFAAGLRPVQLVNNLGNKGNVDSFRKTYATAENWFLFTWHEGRIDDEVLDDVTILFDDAVDEDVASPRVTRAVRPVVARHARERFNTLPKVAIAFRNSSAKQKLEMRRVHHNILLPLSQI